MVIVPPKDTILMAGIHAYGHFNSSRPNEIGISRIEELNTLESPKATSTAIYQDEKYLQKLLLHELVHWGRYWSMDDDKYVDPASQTDTGDAFENEAYDNPDMPHL